MSKMPEKSEASPISSTGQQLPQLQRLKASDFNIVNQAFSNEEGREIDPNARSYFTRFPSGKILNQDRIGGFCYTKPFAPDILELRNIFVLPQMRNRRFGALLIEFVENIAKADGYRAMILVNSCLYQGKENRSAKSFYLQNGYAEILTTGRSLVFSKHISRAS
jgi:GNAT superfamily N-acetyltransferase